MSNKRTYSHTKSVIKTSKYLHKLNLMARWSNIERCGHYRTLSEYIVLLSHYRKVRPSGAIMPRMHAARYIFISVLTAAPLLAQAPQESYQERDFFSRVRRLTVEGRRAGE